LGVPSDQRFRRCAECGLAKFGCAEKFGDESSERVNLLLEELNRHDEHRKVVAIIVLVVSDHIFCWTEGMAEIVNGVDRVCAGMYSKIGLADLLTPAVF
jgi:hypothetical protein